MPIPSTDDLTVGDTYEITGVDESGGIASLPVGTKTQAQPMLAGFIDPTNQGGHWRADWDGSSYRTIVTNLEFIRHAGGGGIDE